MIQNKEQTIALQSFKSEDRYKIVIQELSRNNKSAGNIKKQESTEYKTQSQRYILVNIQKLFNEYNYLENKSKKSKKKINNQQNQMKQIKNNTSLINFEEHLGKQQKENQVSMQNQQQNLNHDLYKTATFFDPETQKYAYADEKYVSNRHSFQQTAEFLNQNQSSLKSTENFDNQNGTFFPNSKNSFMLNQNQYQENGILDRNYTVPNLSPVQQSLHSSSSNKRSLLGFKLNSNSIRVNQQKILEENEHGCEINSNQQIQDAEFWNKVKMIIAQKEEKNKNKESFVTLPAINQKDESAKKQEKNQNKRILKSHQSMSSGLNIAHKQPSNQQASKSNSYLQNQPQSSEIKPNLKNGLHLKNASQSSNIKRQIYSPQQNQQSQISSMQLDSIRTEESAHIYSPESVKYFVPPSDSFNPNQINSEQQSTKANSTVSAEQIANTSQSLSFLNSQQNQDQLPHNQPYLLNNINSRSENTQIMHYLQNKLPKKDQGSLALKNFLSVQTEPSELQNEFNQFPLNSHKENLFLSKQYSRISQQRLKRINYSSQSQNDLFNQDSLLPQKSESIQSQKLLNFFKNEKNFQQEHLKKGEQKQNILFRTNETNQLNGTIKKKQFDSFSTQADIQAINNINLDKLAKQQLLNSNEDNTCPIFTNPSSGRQNLLSYSNDKRRDQITRMNQQTFIFDNYQLRGEPTENEFSFSDEGTIKITQSAQSCREQAKKINLRSKQQENLVKKLFKIDDKQQQQSKSNLIQNYFNLERTQFQQKKKLNQINHQ